MISKTRNYSMNPSKPAEPKRLYDRCLLFAFLIIVALGLTMVASASITLSERQYHEPFHFVIRQSIYVLFGLSMGGAILYIRSSLVFRYSKLLLLFVIFLLLLVLVPGIGRHVNGSVRWIALGPIGIQVSELAKFTFIIYLAGYLYRKNAEVRTEISGFMKPMIIVAVIGVLLLLEPDFGAAVVIVLTALGMMFLAGVRLRQFIGLLIVVALAMIVLAISSPYRMQRLTTFLNPWAHQYNSGYQLTQSLIAFGRGGVWGVGLGNSIQKLFYLPEAHTDFLFAVIAEELGLLGIMVLFALYITLVYRAFVIGRRAQLMDNNFAGYLAYGFGLWLGLQFMINVGVNSGVLPTKGLTLPLMSYGGSSLVVDMAAIALLLRVDYETRLAEYGVQSVDQLNPSKKKSWQRKRL
jgi:cell division protein FtsW